MELSLGKLGVDLFRNGLGSVVEHVLCVQHKGSQVEKVVSLRPWRATVHLSMRDLVRWTSGLSLYKAVSGYWVTLAFKMNNI